jgi:MarR family transcriptional regulator, lower aerobic nicotinate degradation pathway regulator
MTTPTTAELPSPVHAVARELADSSGFLLARLGIGLKALWSAALEGAGFEVHDYGVLAILGEGTRETQSTIADLLGLDPSRLVALLDSLEQRGLVVRQRDPHDRRRHLVTITTAGQRELARLRILVKGLEDRFFAPLDGEGRATLHELLLQLAAQNDPACCPYTSPNPA